MKFTGTSHSRTFLASWQNKPNGKHALLQHMREMTRALEDLQIEMHHQLAASVPGQPSPHFFEDGNAVQALNNFKAELDQIRRILWFYIEEAAQTAAPGDDYVQQPKDSQGMKGLLKPVASVSGDAETLAGEVQQSFLTRLDVVMDSYYMQGKKPMGNTKAKRMGY